MPLTREELEKRKEHFWKRTAQFASMGFDRSLAAPFIADEAGKFEGPALDLGTGMGLMAGELARRGLDVVSADINTEDQQVAAYLIDDPVVASRIRFTEADGATLPFPGGHFGCAFTMDVLHHLTDGAAVLRELMRVVKPGGRLAVGEFSAEGFALVSRVQAAEGRLHPEGPVTFDWARGFLAGMGAREIKTAQGHVHRVAVFQNPPAGAPPAFAALDRSGLFKALDVFAKNWLAHDGCWFLAAEERLGNEAAMELDARSWERFSVVEAKRIMASFGVSENGGLESLEKVLGLRMYAFINPQRLEWSDDRKRLRFYMESCRVQEARRKKGLPDFPCKSVGQVEFSGLARTVDERIRVRCLYCPPDPSEARGCGWEFYTEG